MVDYDLAIIGAGIAGLAVSYSLITRRPDLKIIVLEKERIPGSGATGRCTGGIRHQFTHPLNVLLTALSYPFWQNFTRLTGEPISFRPCGYLLLTSSPQKWQELQAMAKLLEDLNIPLIIFSPEEMAHRYPFLNTIDLLGGTFCPLDAYADPGSAVAGYYRQIRRAGVEVSCNEEVIAVDVDHTINPPQVNGLYTRKRYLPVKLVINAAGPWFDQVCSLAGLPLPAYSFRRQVYVLTPCAEIPPGIPLTVDLDSGCYIHVEKSGTIILGGTDRNTRPGYDLTVDHSMVEQLYPLAVHRFPPLADSGIAKIYVGLRSLTPDDCGILGESSRLKGFFLLGGFGGHGFMHAPALGEIAAALILEGHYHQLDLKPLHPDRFLAPPEEGKQSAEGHSEKNIF